MGKAGTLPTVSIVLNNHNYGRYLGEAVESALAQTYERVEVVVVDDGSTDDSREILAGYGDQIRVVLQPNAGQAAALNAGVAASSGDIVMFLDADDALEPDAARAVAEAWRPEVIKVQGLVRLVDDAGRPAGGTLPSDPLTRGQVDALMLRSCGFASTGTTGSAFARRVLERLLPIPVESWRKAPDTYLLTLAPFMGEFAAVERVIGRVRIHGANKWSMNRFDPTRLLDHLEVDRQRAELLRCRGPALGVEVPEDWLLGSPTHLQSRLASHRLAPEHHPYPGDSARRLAWRGVRAALRHRGFALRKRLLFALWFLAAGLLPRRAARAVVEFGFVRGARPGWFQRLIERGAAGGSA